MASEGTALRHPAEQPQRDRVDVDAGLSAFAATTPDPDRPPAASKRTRKPTKRAAPDAAPAGRPQRR
jgi:hypothetical protein